MQTNRHHVLENTNLLMIDDDDFRWISAHAVSSSIFLARALSQQQRLCSGSFQGE
jgi:hypothetical protein